MAESGGVTGIGTVSNSGAINLTNSLSVGGSGDASLSIDSGTVSSQGVVIGQLTGSNGFVNVGINGVLDNHGNPMTVGQDGAGTFMMQGALLTDSLMLGSNSDATGYADLSPTGAITIPGSVTVGDNGAGTLNLHSGTVNVGGDIILANNGGSGTVSVDGGFLSIGDDLFVGYNNAGTLLVNGGSVSVAVDLDLSLGGVSIGDMELQNTNFAITRDLVLGGGAASLTIGSGATLSAGGVNVVGGTSVITLNGGTFTALSLAGDSSHVFAMNSGVASFGSVSGTNFIQFNGGHLTSGSTLTLDSDPASNFTSGNLTVPAGSSIYAQNSDFIVGATGAATLEVGGEVETGVALNADIVIAQGGAATGNVTLDSTGVLQADQNLVIGDAGQATLNVNGGIAAAVHGQVTMANQFGATANVTVDNGGTISAGTDVVIGNGSNGGTAQLDIINGAVSAANNIAISNSTVTVQSAGSLNAAGCADRRKLQQRDVEHQRRIRLGRHRQHRPRRGRWHDQRHRRRNAHQQRRYQRRTERHRPSLGQ